MPTTVNKDKKKRVLSTNDRLSEVWGNPEEMTGVQTEILSKKKLLLFWSREVYRYIKKNLSEHTVTLEMGSGSSLLWEHIPGLIRSNILFVKENDLVFSAFNIPFKDSSVGNIILINVLHHLQDPVAFFEEAERVLKPGGGLYISTVGPKHEIYNLSKPLGNHENLIQDFGFRSGERFFFFDNERYLDYYLSKIFTNVETGRVTEKLMTMDLDFLISYATKPLDN